MNKIKMWFINKIIFRYFFFARIFLKLEAILKIITCTNFKMSTSTYAIEYNEDIIKKMYYKGYTLNEYAE